MIRRPIVAIDFDGTIIKHEYPELGPLLPGAADTIRWIHEWADVIIWTCRSGWDDVRIACEFLKENHIPFDDMNRNMPGIGFCPYPKIYFDVGIDDRNLGGLPPWFEIRQMLEKFKEGWEK